MIIYLKTRQKNIIAVLL